MSHEATQHGGAVAFPQAASPRQQKRRSISSSSNWRGTPSPRPISPTPSPSTSARHGGQSVRPTFHHASSGLVLDGFGSKLGESPPKLGMMSWTFKGCPMEVC